MMKDSCRKEVKYEYTDDGDGFCANNAKIRWKMTLPNNVTLRSSFAFLPPEMEATFFYLDNNDFKWIEDNKWSDDFRKHLTSLDTFSRANPAKLIYLREIRSSSIKNSEVRRVFTDEVLEILPIVLRQQNTPIEDSDGRLQKYQKLWKSSDDNFFKSIDFDEFHRVLEEFNIDKGLITIVPDPVYNFERREIIENGRNVAITLVCPDGRNIQDTSQAVLLIFLSTVCRRNWNVEECHIHPNCNEQRKERIVAIMREMMKQGENSFVSVCKCKSIMHYLEDLCQISCLRQHYRFGSTMYLDTSGAQCRVNSSTDYAKIAGVYGLPVYKQSFKDDSDTFSIGDEIPVWVARLFLTTGWATQFFDKDSADLKKLIFEALAFKVPLEKTNSAWSFLSNLLEQDEEVFRTEDRNAKMLRAAQERKEKLQKRKAQNKKNKTPAGGMTSSERARDEKKKEQQRLLAAGTPHSSVDIATVSLVDSSQPEATAEPETEQPENQSVDIFDVLIESFQEKLKQSNVHELAKNVTPANVQEFLEEAIKSMPNTSEEEKSELMEKLNLQTNPLLWDTFCNGLIRGMNKARVAVNPSASEAARHETSFEDRVEEKPLVEQQISTDRIEDSISKEISSDTPTGHEEGVVPVAENPSDSNIDSKKIPEESSDSKIPNPIQSKCCSKCLRTSEMCNEAEKELKVAQNTLEMFEKKAKRTNEVEKKMEEMEIEMKRLKGFEEKARRMDDLEKQLESEKKTSKELKKKAKRVNDVEKRMKEKESELGQMKSEFDKSRLENEKMKAAIGRMKMVEERSDEVKKQMKQKDYEMKNMKSELNKLKTVEKEMKTKDRENERSMNRMRAEISEFQNAQEAAVMKISSLEEQIRQFHITEESLQNEMRLIQNNKELENSEKQKVLEGLQMSNKRLSLQNADQQQTIQGLYSRLASESFAESTLNPEPTQGNPENVDFKSEILMIRDALNRLETSQSLGKPDHIRFTLLRHQKISDNFHEKKQLKLAKTMTERLSSMSNRSEIRELASYEYQQYEASFQNYYQTVVVNIQKMKETGDCSLITPLPSPPSFSERFMNEYWNQMNQNEPKDFECCICLNEMKSNQKTLECDQCKKVTHLECSSQWLKVTRSCPHCRREQLDPNEFPPLT